MGWGISGTARFGERPLFEEIALPLEPGWTCLLGPSGGGKSTILRLLAGLDTGVQFDGRIDVPDRIGWMAQGDLMQPRLTVAQNVTLVERLAGRRPDPDRAAALLASVGLEGLGRRRPDTLSGGQRQRVALARTLMQDAPLVLLDEPFSALDPATRVAMQDLAHARLSGRSVLLVTHDPIEALRLGNRIFLLAGGSLHNIPGLAPPLPRPPSDPELARAGGLLLDRIMAL
ncbi:Hydroxymethylpyrimidine ABC transporter, ATPase component [Rhodovulum sp. P5]|uniref:ABC transporter ATP-binding protein n=1 Tax=Rhodovulum sp. P5 TaxID=1564506 RepID=UPI0009C30626|nr:ATP-binding cassette domain-containing protein [Rhodovulum sp. P5]ARE39079.1 Hydroxymethylpyrimidine ABC transporter, ATPase component [Rhodovulum sp. P5]